MVPMQRIAALVLAGGLSRRLGYPKQLVELCGKPALQWVLDAVQRTSLEPRVLVLNPDVARSRALETEGFVVVVNERAGEGQSTSIRAGLAVLPDDVDAVVFFLGDQPFIDPAVAALLVDRFRATQAAIVRPRYADGPGHPILIARRLFPELLALEGDTGARPVLARYRDEIVTCDVPERSIPLDLDTPEDIERARQLCREQCHEP
jgi:molybdenum cofactor cytidylyltransferase